MRETNAARRNNQAQSHLDYMEHVEESGGIVVEGVRAVAWGDQKVGVRDAQGVRALDARVGGFRKMSGC